MKNLLLLIPTVLCTTNFCPAIKQGVAKKTGISRFRSSELTLNEGTHLRAKERYLISLAIDVGSSQGLKKLYKDVNIKK